MLVAVLDADGSGSLTWREALGCCCQLKTAAKVPLLRLAASARFLDQYWRVIFPLVYVPYVLYMLSIIDYGRAWSSQIAGTPALATCS